MRRTIFSIMGCKKGTPHLKAYPYPNLERCRRLLRATSVLVISFIWFFIWSASILGMWGPFIKFNVQLDSYWKNKSRNPVWSCKSQTIQPGHPPEAWQAHHNPCSSCWWCSACCLPSSGRDGGKWNTCIFLGMVLHFWVVYAGMALRCLFRVFCYQLLLIKWNNFMYICIIL